MAADVSSAAEVLLDVGDGVEVRLLSVGSGVLLPLVTPLNGCVCAGDGVEDVEANVFAVVVVLVSIEVVGEAAGAPGAASPVHPGSQRHCQANTL